MPHCLWNLPWLSKRNHPHLYIPLTKYYWPSWCQVHFQELGTFQWIKPGPCLKEVAFQWDDIVQFSHSVVSDSLQSHESQHTRPACPSPTPRVHPNSCASSQWCYPAISSSGIPFSCPQSLPASIFSNESTLLMRWPKCWSFSFSIIPSKEIPGLISFRMDWLDLVVQGTLKSFLQHHSSKASILWHSDFFIAQRSHPYMTAGKTIALTRQTL